MTKEKVLLYEFTVTDGFNYHIEDLSHEAKARAEDQAELEGWQEDYEVQHVRTDAIMLVSWRFHFEVWGNYGDKKEEQNDDKQETTIETTYLSPI